MMKQSMRWLSNQPLKLISSQSTEQSSSKSAKLSTPARLWKAFMHHLVQSRELQVWYSCDQTGNLWWSAYDPVTGQSIDRLSEAEMRAWVEQRHYQSA